MSKKTILNNIVDQYISFKNDEIRKIKKRILHLTNEISNNLGKMNINYTYIGSYTFKTNVKYNDGDVDIDAMLTIPRKEVLKNDKPIRDRIKSALENYEKNINNSEKKITMYINQKQKVIQVSLKYGDNYNNDDINDQLNNYHIDFPITYLDKDGKRKLILKNKELEVSEVNYISKEFKNTFKGYINFHRRVIKLFKMWIKINIKEKEEKIPSIAILQSCMEVNKNSHQSILDNLISNAKNIKNKLSNENKYELFVEPRNDIFEEKNTNKIIKHIDKLILNIEEIKKIKKNSDFEKKIKEYFLGK